MIFGNSPIFRSTPNPEPVPSESQILIFPKDAPSNLNHYTIAILSNTNGKPEKYLINHKHKILLKLIKIKYKDAPTTAFINNNVVLLKHIIVAYKYDFMYIILKILYSTKDSFSYVSSCINSYYNKHDDLMIKNNVLSLWDSNFSDVQSRVKKYTFNAIFNERMILQPYYDYLYNSLSCMKDSIIKYIKDKKFHFLDYSTIEDAPPHKNHVKDNKSEINTTANHKKSKHQSTYPIETNNYKTLSINDDKLELFCWSIIKSNVDIPNVNKIIPEDLLMKINKFNIRVKNAQSTPPDASKKQKTLVSNTIKKIKITSNQTTISSFFKKAQ